MISCYFQILLVSAIKTFETDFEHECDCCGDTCDRSDLANISLSGLGQEHTWASFPFRIIWRDNCCHLLVVSLCPEHLTDELALTYALEVCELGLLPYKILVLSISFAVRTQLIVDEILKAIKLRFVLGLRTVAFCLRGIFERDGLC